MNEKKVENVAGNLERAIRGYTFSRAEAVALAHRFERLLEQTIPAEGMREKKG